MLKVVGFKEVNYTSRKDGAQKSGYEVYTIEQNPAPHIIGTEAHEFYLNRAYSTYKPIIGDLVKPSYNRFGKVDDFFCIGHEEC